jgi:outer membrane protein TolC
MKNSIIALLLLFTMVTFSQTKKNYNIGLLLDSQTEDSNELLSSLKNEIKAVVGEDATITFPEANVLVNDFNLNKARENYTKLLEGNTDIILAFGLVNNVVISKLKTFEKPTILFGAVNKDFDFIDENNKTSVISNFTYIILPQSYKQDLKTFKELTSFTTVGVAIEEGLVNVLPFKNLFDKATQELDVRYKMIPYKTSDDITNALNKDIDAFYLASGFFLNTNDIANISAKLIEEKIPSFTNTTIDDVKNGMMATNNSEDNLEQFFRRIALTIESYVNGQNLSESQVFIEFEDKLTLNKNTAEKVGLSIKYSLIGNTNFVGNFANVVSEKKYNLLDVMKTVVGENLILQSSKKEVALSEQDVRTSKSNYYPSVTASASGTYVDPNVAEVSLGQSPEFSTSGSITLEQTLFSEAANANITIQKELLNAQQEQYNTDELDAIFDVSNVYFNALILKANLQIQNENLNLTKKNLQIARQNYEAGQSGKSDVLRFRSEAAQNTQSLVEASNQLEQTFFVLNQLLNNPIDFKIDIDEAELGEGILKNYSYQQLRDLIDDPKLRKPFVQFLVKIAKENAPEIKSLDYNLKANKRSLKLNGYGRFIPTLALQAQYNNEFSRSGKGTEFAVSGVPSDDYFVGASLSIPLFNRTQTNINRQIATIQQDQLTINKDNVALAIETNVNSAILDLINQIANIEISKISEETAKESLELTRVSYSSGAVNIVQLLDAQNNFLVSQQARITAVYNYLSSSIQLERFISYYFLLHTTEENQAFIAAFNDYLQNRE